MKTRSPSCITGAILLGFGLSACSQSTNLSSLAQAQPAVMRAASSLDDNSSTLYVLNGGGGKGASYVSVYAQSGSKYIRSIPNAFGIFAVGNKGLLFLPVGQSFVKPYVLNVYAEQGAALVQTLKSQHPFYDPTVDSHGNLFIACAQQRICEYPADRTTGVKNHISRQIQLKLSAGGVGGFATDPSGDLATFAGDNVLVFPPEGKSPSRTINVGPTLLAFDNLGNLYVGIAGVQSTTIEVFAPGATSPSRTIEDDNGNSPVAMHLDQSNNLYVLTGTDQSATVSIYPYGASNPALEIMSGLVAGTSHDMTVSPSGELFVSNYANSPGNVLVYPPGQTTPKLTITKNISAPTEVRVSSQ